MRRVVLAVYNLLPARWNPDVRMFLVGMVLGSAVVIPVVVALVLLSHL